MIAIPDTQFYSENTGRNPSAGGTGAIAAIFNAQTQWIVDNRATRNIALRPPHGRHRAERGLGGNPIEWLVADVAMKTIENPVGDLARLRHPVGRRAGESRHRHRRRHRHHDVLQPVLRRRAASPDGTTTAVTTARNNNNNYELFSASGLDFIVIHLEYNTGALSSYQAVLDWADAVLKAYPNRRAIVTSHWIMNTGKPGRPSARRGRTFTTR